MDLATTVNSGRGGGGWAGGRRGHIFDLPSFYSVEVRRHMPFCSLLYFVVVLTNEVFFLSLKMLRKY